MDKTPNINIINGFSAEVFLNNWVANCHKIKPFKLPSSREIVNLANSSEIGKIRLEKAKLYLIKEFGIYYRSQNQIYLSFDWEQVPSQVILDYVFGIDLVFSYLGYVIAVDVTVNPKTIDGKVRKLHRLKHLWEKLAIDKACICLITNTNTENILASLKTIIKSSKLINQIVI